VLPPWTILINTTAPFARPSRTTVQLDELRQPCTASSLKNPHCSLRLWLFSSRQSPVLEAHPPQPAAQAIMSLVLDSVGPPPHLLQSRTPEWHYPYAVHYGYPASSSSPAPMSPQSLQSYMPHGPETPIPSQELSSLPTSTWCSPSVSAPECYAQVRAVYSRSVLSAHIPTSRVATPHMDICRRTPLPLPCHHRPHLLTITWHERPSRLRESKSQLPPCLQLPPMLGTLYYPSLHARQRNPSQTMVIFLNHPPAGGQTRT
jgi:hypothetical protein